MTLPPDDAALRLYLLGELPPEELHAVVAYLDSHPEFAMSLGTLAATDTLVSSLRQGAAQPEAPDVARLVERFSELSTASTPPEAALRTATNAPERPNSNTEVTLPPEGDYGGLLAPPNDASELGWLGGYRILRELGRGGMGLVFAAEEVALGRRVALKVMAPALAANPVAKKRFVQEAKAASAVEHDHIVPIYRIGEDRGVPFLAMPLLLGAALDEGLRARRPLPTADVLRIGRQIAAGLAAAHNAGLIHRDIKPSNIWLERTVAGEFRRVKILDFGLARSSAAAGEHLTHSGAVLGTPAYMAPEQARGEAVDARADLFSLGAVLYQMATGRRPFPGDDPFSILTALATQTPESPISLNAELPPALSALISRLLAKNPAQRPQSAEEVIAELDRIGAAKSERPQAATSPRVRIQLPSDAASRPVVVYTSPPADDAAPPPVRRRLRRAAFAIAGVLLFGALTFAAANGPTIIRIASNEGELVVAVDDPNVEIVVKGTNVEILDANGKRYLVSAGREGEIEIREKGTDNVLVVEKFRVQRGGKTVVAVSHEKLAAARMSEAPKPVAEPAPKPIPPAIPTRVELPAKDAFPGTLVLYETFDNPQKCPIQQGQQDGTEFRVANGHYAISALKSKAGEGFVKDMPAAKPDMAFVVRLRPVNAQAFVAFRTRMSDVRTTWYQYHITSEGHHSLRRMDAVMRDGGWKHTSTTLSTVPGTHAANAEGVTVVGRTVGPRVQVWVNGVPLGDLDIAIGSEAPYHHALPLRIGGVAASDRPAAVHIDHIAMWNLPPEPFRGIEPPAPDAFPGTLLARDTGDDPTASAFDLNEPGTALRDGVFRRDFTPPIQNRKWVSLGRPTRDAAAVLRVRVTDTHWTLMFRERSGPARADYLCLRVFAGGSWSLDRVVFHQEGEKFVPQPIQVLAKSQEPEPELESGRWLHLTVWAAGEDVAIWLNGRCLAAVRDPNAGDLALAPAHGALSFTVDPLDGKRGRFEVDHVAIWDLNGTIN